MSLWQTMTGSDLTREWEAFEARAEALPADYRAAWEQIKVHLFPYAGFTGRNLVPILDGALGLGDDIEGFCAALAGGEGARSYRDRWREQLNRNVARKIGQLGG
jgi:DNA-binding ferritin-like protein (Dps family)